MTNTLYVIHRRRSVQKNKLNTHERTSGMDGILCAQASELHKSEFKAVYKVHIIRGGNKIHSQMVFGTWRAVRTEHTKSEISEWKCALTQTLPRSGMENGNGTCRRSSSSMCEREMERERNRGVGSGGKAPKRWAMAICCQRHHLIQSLDPL